MNRILKALKNYISEYKFEELISSDLLEKILKSRIETANCVASGYGRSGCFELAVFQTVN